MATLAQSGLVGMYPATAKLPTWTVAECARLALAALPVADDPWPDWLRERAGVLGLADALTAVHAPLDPFALDLGQPGESVLGAVDAEAVHGVLEVGVIVGLRRRGQRDRRSRHGDARDQPGTPH